MITTIIDDQKLTVSGDWGFLAGFLGVLITTGLGMMWRLAVTRSRPKDPESSIAGYVLPATRAIGNRLNRNGKTSRKSPNNNNPQ